MRTIIVIFTERKLSLNEVSSYKKYKFLCNYDTISLYDMVEDPRYTGKMEDELKFNLKYINSKVCNTCFCASVPANEAEKYNTLADLAIIAKFFNGSWKKTTNNTGYFLGNFNNGCGPIIDTCSGVGVYQHSTVQYAGVVYFKNREDAIKAVKILGKRVKSLFD